MVQFGNMPKSTLPFSNDLTIHDREELEQMVSKKQKLLFEISEIKKSIIEVQNELDSLQKQLSQGKSSSTASTFQATKLFNEGNAEESIELLVKCNEITNDPISIATYLRETVSIDRVRLGDYLGKPSSKEVLYAFVDLLNYQDEPVFESLRMCLKTFVLPKESQIIDRILEGFATAYMKQNPNTEYFNDKEACFFLCFAILILYTSLHNKNVSQSDKISLDSFKKMSEGQNGEKEKDNFDSEFLTEVYNAVAKGHFAYNVEESVCHILKEGFLYKQGGRFKSWKKRWFVLAPSMIYYFEHTDSARPRGLIPLENVGVSECPDTNNKSFCFQIYSIAQESAQQSGFIKGCKYQNTTNGRQIVEGHHKKYIMSASSEEDRAKWIENIRDSISKDLFTELLCRRSKERKKSSST